MKREKKKQQELSNFFIEANSVRPDKKKVLKEKTKDTAKYSLQYGGGAAIIGGVAFGLLQGVSTWDEMKGLEQMSASMLNSLKWTLPVSAIMYRFMYFCREQEIAADQLQIDRKLLENSNPAFPLKNEGLKTVKNVAFGFALTAAALASADSYADTKVQEALKREQQEKLIPFTLPPPRLNLDTTYKFKP